MCGRRPPCGSHLVGGLRARRGRFTGGRQLIAGPLGPGVEIQGGREKMSAELEVLDQLLGGDLPLNLISQLFADANHRNRAVPEMLRDGSVVLLGPSGSAVPQWNQRAVLADPANWESGTPYLLSLTLAGAARVG